VAKVRKEEDFLSWYNDIVEKAGLTDKRYPIKGMNVWTPYGWKAMFLVDQITRHLCEERGYSEVNFPLLIPETEFNKEADHIKGFGGEVYWVTHGGDNELEVKLLLRPTSETAIYPMFALWVRSHADLPLKVFQIVNVFRYETKMTRAFLRVREIHFFEGHTAQKDFEAAEAQVHEDQEIWGALARELALPYLMNRRPDWDKFAGAFYSLGADTVTPTGKALQVATIHHYKDNFAKPYGISYEDTEGKHQFAHQTTYGMSERLLGAIVAIHGDDKGLVMPPAVAPVQVVVIPILTKDSKEEPVQAAEAMVQELKKGGLRAEADLRDMRPGAKYFDHELRGVPLRLEVGPRDLAQGKFVAVPRDTGTKRAHDRARLWEAVAEEFELLRGRMESKAKRIVEEAVQVAEKVDDVKAHEGISLIGWCGDEACGKRVEEGADTHVLGTYEGGDLPSGAQAPAKCIICGKPSPRATLVARTY
jgi:prolyl-tRNA synthetase